jgi:hypothetical protein
MVRIAGTFKYCSLLLQLLTKDGLVHLENMVCPWWRWAGGQMHVIYTNSDQATILECTPRSVKSGNKLSKNTRIEMEHYRHSLTRVVCYVSVRFYKLPRAFDKYHGASEMPLRQE